MSYDKIKALIEQQLAEIRAAGLYKTERVLLGPQGGSIRVAQGTVINLCANNYLGLADHPAIVEAAAHAIRMRGYGMASVRFICGRRDRRLHGGPARVDRIAAPALTTVPVLECRPADDLRGGLEGAGTDPAGR